MNFAFFMAVNAAADASDDVPLNVTNGLPVGP